MATMRLRVSVCLVWAALAIKASGTNLVISAFERGGWLTWTNAVPGRGYSVEWSPSLTDGNWTDTWASLSMIVAQSNSVTVRVPMFYRVVEHGVPPDMVLIPAGPFAMGYNLYATQSTVTVSAFCIGRQEVTKTQWDEIRTWGATHGYTDLAAGQAGSSASNASTHPVTQITWYDCVKWCNARSEKEGWTPCYYTNATLAPAAVYRTGSLNLSNEWVNWTGGGFRLPTDAEWEKAARGGLAGKLYPWGDAAPDATKANYNSNVGATTPVGNYPATGYGLYDVAGNVWELCWDWYDVPLPLDGSTNPRGPPVSPGGTRVGRGESWNGMPDVKVSLRYYIGPASSWNGLGFRCAEGL